MLLSDAALFIPSPWYACRHPNAHALNCLPQSQGTSSKGCRQGWHFNGGPGKTVGIQNELVPGSRCRDATEALDSSLMKNAPVAAHAGLPQ